MLDRGYFTIARFRGTPLRLHWTLPVGALLFSGFRFEPGFWLGFFLLVLIHELGHAFLVKLYRHQVTGIDVTGFGGLCRWSGIATPVERGVIAWGGVLAQALLLAATFGILLVTGRPVTRFTAELASVFTFTNLYLIALNLVPVPPLDGYEAWKLAGHLIRGGKLGRSPRAAHRSGSARAGGPVAPNPGGKPSPEAMRELARMLEQIGDDARKSRRS